MNDHGARLVRAAYTAETITVYQAYSPPIASAAVRAGTLVPPFSRDRMTWIKPSFGWMMHRSGWARKPGQERVLAIEISRDGFGWALAHSTPAQHPTPDAWAAAKASSPVRVQWDPDRSLTGAQLARRAIQVGLSGDAVPRYTDDWIRSITDITGTVRQAEQLIRAGQVDEAVRQLPSELVYPLGPALAQRIGADPGNPATASVADSTR
jgi:hypothetical protein